MYEPTSRYYTLETAEHTLPDGRVVSYTRRRFVPKPDDAPLLAEKVVNQGERLDHITAQYLGDPEQYWRVCDANLELNPKRLEATGLRLRIPLPRS